MQLCIGLHLPPTLSGYLLRAAGKAFTGTKLHLTYKVLLSSCYEHSVGYCNILLTGMELPPLGRTAKAAK